MGKSILFIFLVLLLASCNITKGKQSKTTDTTQVNTTDTGSVKKNTSTESNKAEWERQTLIFNKDTTVNNYYITNGKNEPINYNALAAIINERGTFNQDKQTTVYDSSWKKAFDSLKILFEEKTKDKTESGPNFWQMLALSFGAILIIGIVFLLLKSKILKS